jgi:hypothetical protein
MKCGAIFKMKNKIQIDNLNQKEINKIIFDNQMILDDLKKAIKIGKNNINFFRVYRYNKFGGSKPNCLK